MNDGELLGRVLAIFGLVLLCCAICHNVPGCVKHPEKHIVFRVQVIR